MKEPLILLFSNPLELFNRASKVILLDACLKKGHFMFLVLALGRNNFLFHEAFSYVKLNV